MIRWIDALADSVDVAEIALRNWVMGISIADDDLERACSQECLWVKSSMRGWLDWRPYGGWLG